MKISQRPFLDGGRWWFSPRAHGVGATYRALLTGVTGASDLADAVVAMLREVERLRRARDLAAGQTALALPGAAFDFAGAVDLYRRQKRYRTEAGRSGAEKYLAALCREIGADALAGFSGAAGKARLVSLVNEWEARCLAPRTIRNRIHLVRAVLVAANDAGLLAQVPGCPALPPLPRPITDWFHEATARAIADEVGHPRFHPPDLARWLYVLAMFYFGSHPSDLDTFTAGHLFLDAGLWLRRNTKSARVVTDAMMPIPEPFLADLLVARDAAGGVWHPSFPIFGGPWKAKKRIERLRAAAARAKVEHLAPRLTSNVWRHSCAAYLFLCGLSIDGAPGVIGIKDYLGHVDRRMLDSIYLTVKPRAGGRLRLLAPASAAAPAGGARILSLLSARDKKGA